MDCFIKIYNEFLPKIDNILMLVLVAWKIIVKRWIVPSIAENYQVES